MIEFYQLEQLVTIAKAGTISKAAEILHISQPGLTRSIQRLEESLGVKLFDRKKNKISLNDTGKMAVKYAQNIIDEKNSFIIQLQRYDQIKHVISIGSCAPAPIWGLSHIFNKHYSEMKINHHMEAHENLLIEGLKKNQYSIIVLTHPLNDSDYKSVELFEEYLYLSVPPAHPFALFQELAFEDLDGESVLLFSKIGFWNDVCIKMIPQSHLLIQQDADTFMELTRLSALPIFRSNITINREAPEKNRISIPISNPEACATYYAIYHKSQHNLFKIIENEIKNLDWEKVNSNT